jgi:hypothetical protein
MKYMKRTWYIALATLMVACAPTRAEYLPPLPTATTVRVIQTTPIPTLDRQLQALDSTQPVSATLQMPECVSAPPRVQHTVDATVDYGARTVHVLQTMRVGNVGDSALAELVFDVEPNRYAGTFALESVSVDKVAAPAYELTGRRLTVSLSQGLEVGCSVEVTLSFNLVVPGVRNGLVGHSGYFGSTERQLNLGHWLPILAYRVGTDWITHDARALGEQVIAEVADWEVTLHVTDPPANLAVAAPGQVTRSADGSWQIVHTEAREIALSLSDRFDVRSAQASNGVMIEAYTLGDTLVETDSGRIDGADHAVDVAVRSLTMFSDLFGAYPDERLVLVQGDFPDGMEFSGLIFVGASWFERWPGSPQSYLTIITAHEVAHQWWYASVGSDQALTPWLDEALATYSEYIFYEEYYPELRDWWWQFRVYSFVPEGFADIEPVSSSVYRFDNLRSYINAVYLRGARMLHELRQDVGTDAFFAWLEEYAQIGSGLIMTPANFWARLTPEEMAQTEDTRAFYMGE